MSENGLRTSSNTRLNLYPIIICMLVIISLATYDYKAIFLGIQGFAFIYSLVLMILNDIKINNVLSEFVTWALLFITWSFSSLLWTNNYNRTALLSTLSIIQVVIIAFCIIVYCRGKDQVMHVLYSIMLSSILLCIRFFAVIPVSFWGKQVRFSRETSIFGTNTPALTMAFASLIAFWHLTEKMRKNKKKSLIIFEVLTIFSGMFVSLLMGTRKGLIIFIVGALIIYVSKEKNIIRAIARVVLGIGFIVLLYLMFVEIDLLYNSIGYRIDSLIAGIQGGEADKSTTTRYLFMKQAWNAFLEHPLIGVGQDGFRYINTIQFTYSHCNYVEILANLGIIGFIIYYSLYLRMLVNSIKNKNNNLPFVLVIIFVVIEFASVSYSMELIYILFAVIISMNKREYKHIR